MTDNQNNLQKLWQSIDTPTEMDCGAIRKLARKHTLLNVGLLLLDSLACVVIAATCWFSIGSKHSIVFSIWLALALILSIYLTRELFVTRHLKVQNLSKSTGNYQQFLCDKYESNIRAGHLFVISNHAIVIALTITVGLDTAFTDDPTIQGVSAWLFAIGWTAVLYGSVHWWGARKMKNGKACLARLLLRE